jgi:hypothetical protein
MIISKNVIKYPAMAGHFLLCLYKKGPGQIIFIPLACTCFFNEHLFGKLNKK